MGTKNNLLCLLLSVTFEDLTKSSIDKIRKRKKILLEPPGAAVHEKY
jgi:hypothetical protein